MLRIKLCLIAEFEDIVVLEPNCKVVEVSGRTEDDDNIVID